MKTVTYTAPTHLGIWGNTAATGTLNANTLTLGDATLDAETIKVMKEHIKAFHKEEIRKAIKAGGK